MIVWGGPKRKKEKDGFGCEWESYICEGDVAKMKGAVLLQGPTPHNKMWRFFLIARWKDAITGDLPSEEAAKAAAAVAVSQWLALSGLAIAAD